MVALIFVVGAPHRNKTTHSLASLTTLPPSEEAYFMVGKYTETVRCRQEELLRLPGGDVKISQNFYRIASRGQNNNI